MVEETIEDTNFSFEFWASTYMGHKCKKYTSVSINLFLIYQSSEDGKIESNLTEKGRWIVKFWWIWYGWRFRNPRQQCWKTTQTKSSSKKIELSKLGQTITQKLVKWHRFRMEKTKCHKQSRQSNRQEQAFDERETRWMEQGEPFWLDFEHGISEWKTNEVEQMEYNCTSSENMMIFFSNEDLEEARKKLLKRWVENKVYIQVPDQG